MKRAPTDLELTGERTLPGIRRENYWFQRHLVAYEYAVELAADRRVIDVGCGEGYGPSLLARSASRVLGVDIAPEVVEHARRCYRASNLEFEIMEVNHLEVSSDSFDLAVSFQVVEHLVDVSGYFGEIARVVGPGGKAVFSTPNLLTISPGSDGPINPFHLREYVPQEFKGVLEEYFDDVSVLGLFHAGWLRLNDRMRVVDFIGVYEMGRFNPRLWTHRLLTPLITTSGFCIKSSGLDRCLDILAVCSNARRG